MEILRVSHLSKKYGNSKNAFYALNDVSFCVRKGEFVAVTGKSGSGKSTLIHLLSGVDSPDSGEVIIDNNSIYNLSDKELTIFRRKNIGIIYQFYNLFPMLTVRENIILPRIIDKRLVSEKVFNSLVCELGLTKKLDIFPNDLSGGQQQRCAIGRALINRPKVLFADEPTGNLDSSNGYKIMKLLKFYNKKYKQTIIMVTHDEKLAMKCDRRIIMKDGRIISDQKNSKR